MRSFFTGLAALDGYIYAVGGWEGSYRLESIERYDPNTNSWTFVHKLKTAVTNPAVIGYDKMLYIAGELCLIKVKVFVSAYCVC